MGLCLGPVVSGKILAVVVTAVVTLPDGIPEQTQIE